MIFINFFQLASFQRSRSHTHIQSNETAKPSKSLAARKKLGLIKGSSHQSEDGDYRLQDEIKRYFFVQVDVDTDIITFWKVSFFIYYIQTF